VGQLRRSMKTYWKIWKSEIQDEWHWVLSMPDSRQHDYSGIAETWEQADKDVNLSVEHYILTKMRPHRTL
jgi:hypothetical protein